MSVEVVVIGSSVEGEVVDVSVKGEVVGTSVEVEVVVADFHLLLVVDSQLSLTATTGWYCYLSPDHRLKQKPIDLRRVFEIV